MKKQMMRITTLAENLVYQGGLIAEHGLSLLIEINQQKILFDTGQGKALTNNARYMRVDLADMDAVVISHGHYDHVGGLEAFLEINSKAPVYLKKDALADKMKVPQKKIGMDVSDSFPDGRIKLVDGPLELVPDVFIMPDIPIRNASDTAFSGFITDQGNGVIPDEFEDELYLAIVQSGQLSVISGCSHRGISNIIQAATDHFNLPLDLVLGGFHLKNCPQEQYQTVLDALRQTDPKRIGVCHCTGVDKFCELKWALGDHVFYNFCGNRID